MATGDMPQITSAVYGASGGTYYHDPDVMGNLLARACKLPDLLDPDPFIYNPCETMPNPTPPTRRLVQVFIADPDPNVPLKAALLYKGELIFTDATDQELYFGVPVVDLLDKHNLARAGWLDREATKRAGKDIFLEPARVRDLRMVVVNVATF